MSQPEHPELEPARLRWDERGQPLSETFDDVYFSRADGLAETRYVFLGRNRLAERFAALHALPPHRRHFTLGETGFGSGLNILAAWQLWCDTAPADARLHLISVDRYPLTREDLHRALALWPELAAFAQQLIDQYPPLVTGLHRVALTPGRVNLTLIFDEAANGLAQLAHSDHPAFRCAGPGVDAWMLDGFAPAKNPGMWTPELFATLARLSQAHTSLATFTAAGLVRRGLREAGFEVRKVRGFGRKREMLTAGFRPGTTPSPAPAHRLPRRPPLPWHLPDPTSRVAPHSPRTALVIGAGLAGCHSARALAERGWQVTLLEQHEQPAREASGNPQGLLYARLSPKDEPLARFNLLSLSFAQRHYQRFWQENARFGRQCGLLQLATDDKALALNTQIVRRFAGAEELVEAVSADRGSALAGVGLARPGLYFPRSGWLDPAAVCDALLDHPGITFTNRQAVASLRRQNGQWEARGATDERLAHASVAVLANANAARALTQTGWLPLKAIRGQITQLPATSASRSLRLPLCGDGYLAPARDGQHCLGATFNLGDTSTQVEDRDHRANLDQLMQFGGDVSGWFRAQSPAQCRGRVAFRCTTPDYLPLVGPAPDRTAFLSDYAALRKDARLNIERPGRYHPGLFINVGHGSRGLCYTPMSAELLAAHIDDEPMPLDRALVQALNPGRFLIRDLIRKRL